MSFPRAEYADYRKAFAEFYERLDDAAQREADAPASTLLDPASRWNPLINATSTYISGAELDRISLKDLDRYHSTDVNWRVVEGYGTLISKHGADAAANARLSGQRHRSQRQAAAHRHRQGRDRRRSGHRDGAECGARGRADSALRLRCRKRSRPRAACRWASTTSFSLRSTARKNSKPASGVFGHTDRVATAGYHLRPFGWPMIEAYFGGRLRRGAGTGRSGGVLRFCRVRALRRVRQRFRPPPQADPRAWLGQRSVRARRIFLCIAGHWPIAGRRSPSRSTIDCFSPARPVRGMISRPRMAAISPASPRPSR